MSQNTQPGYDDLDYMPEGIFLFNAKPFTGVAIDHNEHGVKISEAPFVDGKEHGVFKAWHANGRLSWERPYVHGESHGVGREWYEDGSLKSETTYEFGVMMKREIRDREGKIIEVFQRSNDQLYKNVLMRREQAEGLRRR
jgi:antitoxin component YwqK of YwqJK toxin-antitoxin module